MIGLRPGVHDHGVGFDGQGDQNVEEPQELLKKQSQQTERRNAMPGGRERDDHELANELCRGCLAFCGILFDPLAENDQELEEQTKKADAQEAAK